MKNLEKNFKSINWLCYYKDKVVKSLSKYDKFEELVSTQELLESIIWTYDEKFIKKMRLDSPLKIKRFLEKRNVFVVDVIACFENNNLSKPISHYPHTIYESAINMICDYLDFYYDFSSKFEKENEEEKVDKINSAINNYRDEVRKLKQNQLKQLDELYEAMNSKFSKKELLEEIEVINNLKEKVIFTNSNDLEVYIDEKDIDKKWDIFLSKDNYERTYNSNLKQIKLSNFTIKNLVPVW